MLIVPGFYCDNSIDVYFEQVHLRFDIRLP
jgi:hypothetical protein